MIKQIWPSKISRFFRKEQGIARKLLFVAGSLFIFTLGFILQISPVVPLALLTLAVYLNGLNPNLKNKHCGLLNLSLLYVIILTISYFLIREHLSIFYIPFSFAPILAIILFDDLTINLLLTLALSLSAASIAGNNHLLGILFLVSGILASLLAKGIRRRGAIIRAGLIIGIIQAASLFCIEQFKLHNPYNYLILILNGIGSGLLVAGALPIFEYLFQTVTNISLLELADFNSPLLQRMIIEAPGTYHHSLIVGNLSDAACKAIGANSLLARIGAYYHDIGKLKKPDYFSENQGINHSKHACLSPELSKLVIINHVKDGIELAQKYKLKPSLINFIAQHHGNSLVYYFYRRALENLEPNEEVEEEGFRYPGPKPGTKETAIVLLADSVEAAARALKDPAPQKIEELTHKIINNKFIDGQLDECDLTLKDLEKISAVFIKILTSIYHGRIDYPEKAE